MHTFPLDEKKYKERKKSVRFISFLCHSFLLQAYSLFQLNYSHIANIDFCLETDDCCTHCFEFLSRMKEKLQIVFSLPDENCGKKL
jgi:hypothetical protein